MALFGRKRSSIGLDIGSGFVKVVEVDHSGDQPEVTRVAMCPLLPDAIVEGEVMDYGLVSDAVMGLFEEMGLKGAEVVTAVGGHDVIIKKIEMDRMKESDARDVIPGACMDLNEFIETTIEAVLTGTWRCGTEDHEHSWKELQAAGEAVTLDEGNWEDWMNLEAARTLFKAANRGRELMASRAAEGTATLNQTQH